MRFSIEFLKKIKTTIFYFVLFYFISIYFILFYFLLFYFVNLRSLGLRIVEQVLDNPLFIKDLL